MLYTIHIQTLQVSDMRRKIIDILKDTMGGQIIPCKPISLDTDWNMEVQGSNERGITQVFEDNDNIKANPKNPIQLDLSKLSSFQNTSFRYFLDGSRKTYRLADVNFEGNYYPLVGGQICVSVIERLDDGSYKPCRDYCCRKKLLVFPHTTDIHDVKVWQKSLSDENVSFTVLRCTKPVGDQRQDIVDSAISKIHSEMHQLEIDAVSNMTRDNKLSQFKKLVVDGPLEFTKGLDKFQFQFVIGLSKTFTANSRIGRSDVGNITVNLGEGHRTAVFKVDHPSGKIGCWFLRIRDKKHTQMPLQGVVKVECFAVQPEDEENGINSGYVDTISYSLLRERNVTPYKSDDRWASHIYPIYVAEKYAKLLFESDLVFRAAFA